MPLILIIIGVIAALIVGFVYTQNPADNTIDVTAPAIRVEDTAPTPEAPISYTPTDTTITAGSAPKTGTADTGLNYSNGTYNATANYITPGRSSHDVNVTLTLADNTITNVSVNFTGEVNPTSTGWQTEFVAVYQSEVVGKKLDDVSLSRVGGASLTTGAFNEALAKVKAAAQS